MNQLQTWVDSAGHYLRGQQNEGTKLSPKGQLRGHSIQQIGRGAALFGAALPFIFSSIFAKGAHGSAVSTAPRVIGGIVPQSMHPETNFELTFKTNDLFVNSNYGELITKVVEKGKQTLPNWLKFNLHSFHPVSSVTLDDYDNVGELYVLNNSVYFCTYDNFYIFDVSDPTLPTQLGTYSLSTPCRDLYATDDYVYLLESNTFRVFNVSDPYSPTIIGSYATSNFPQAVWVANDTAYIAHTTLGLLILNITAPSSPTLLGSFNTPDGTTDLKVKEDIAYVLCRGELQLIDISNSSTPVLSSTFPSNYLITNYGYSLDVEGDYAYILFDTGTIQGLQIVDISNTTAPILASTTFLPEISCIDLQGDHAYMGSWKIQTLDIRDPFNPKVVAANFNQDPSFNGVCPLHSIGNYIYHGGGSFEIKEQGFRLFGFANQSLAGNYELEVVVENSDQQSASVPFLLRVEGPPIASGTIPSQLADVSAPFSFFIDNTLFSDPNNDVIYYLAEQTNGTPLPSWLSFSTIGIFSGNPQLSDVGTVHIELSAFDGIVLDRANSSFTITVDHFPQVASPITNQVADINKLYTFTVPPETFTDQDVTDTLTYSTNSLPGWLNFTPGTRTFSGTPSAGDAGSSTISVTAADDPGATASSTFSLTVGPFPSLLNPIPNQTTAVGFPYHYAIPTNTFTIPPGEFLTYRATQSDGTTLPNWLGFLSSKVEFQGAPQPSDKGEISLKVIAEDLKGGATENSFNLKVVDSLSQENARIGGSFVYTIPNDMISAPLGPVTYSITLGDGSPLPTWLNYNSATNSLTGTPPNGSEKTYSILITADDGIQAPTLGELSLAVVPNSAPKVANPLSNQLAQVGQPYRLVVPENTFRDSNDDPLSLSAKRINDRDLPSWLTFTDRTLMGKPSSTNTGAFSDEILPLQICATDGDEEACSVFDLSVQGTSEAERTLTILGPLATLGAAFIGCYKNRGLFLNPWNRKDYDRGTVQVPLGVPFSYKLKSEKSSIKRVQAFEGRSDLEEKGWKNWLHFDQPIRGGELLPDWLAYNGGKTLLESEDGPQPGDEGLYTVRVFGHGKMILDEIKLKVGSTEKIAL